VALTANSGKEFSARALEQGFDEFWSKPIDMADTLTKIDLLLAKLRPAPTAGD
jgi:CheY-like chemotaxis protein